jgi:hypothetical protein
VGYKGESGSDDSSDLEHHSSISAALRTELETYKAHFGLLPEKSGGKDKSNGSSGRSTPAQRGRRVSKMNGDRGEARPGTGDGKEGTIRGSEQGRGGGRKSRGRGNVR